MNLISLPRSKQWAILSTSHQCPAPAFTCVGWKRQIPLLPTSRELVRWKQYFSSSLCSVSTDSTAEGGRPLRERDLPAGESEDRKNDSHLPSFWSDLHTRRPEALPSSWNCYLFCSHIDNNVSIQHLGLGPLPGAE